jgi:hypothetical protein
MSNDEVRKSLDMAIAYFLVLSSWLDIRYSIDLLVPAEGRAVCIGPKTKPIGTHRGTQGQSPEKTARPQGTEPSSVGSPTWVSVPNTDVRLAACGEAITSMG